MAQLDVICWLWGNKYGPADVSRLQKQIFKYLKKEHKFHCFADRPTMPGIDVRMIQDLNLCDRHCFCRLRMFDKSWQKKNDFNGYILSLDLDLVITGSLDDLFANPRSDFMILKGVNKVNPNPFNASITMLKAHTHRDVWEDFSLDAASKIAYHEFSDDQGWLWHKMPDADGWQVGADTGVYGFQKPGWPLGEYGTNLPVATRIVAFIGKRKPGMYQRLPWVEKNWSLA